MSDQRSTSLWRRLAWFVGLWCASVLTLGVVAWVLRQLMAGVGLSAGG